MLVEGKQEIEISGAISHYLSGEEIIIPAGVVHSVRNIGETTARWLHGYVCKKLNRVGDIYLYHNKF